MSNTTQIFDKVENGAITRQNVRRGTNGIGRLSDDSVYLAKGYYPHTGTKPSYDTATQTISGPVHNVDEVNKNIILVWTVSDIPIETLRQNGFTAITAYRESKYQGVMPITISSGTFNYPYSEMLAMAHFNRFQAITAGVMTCPTYWRDEDNNNNPVIVGDFLIMAESVNTYISNFATRAHTDKAAIELATTKAAIDIIVDAYLAYDGL